MEFFKTNSRGIALCLAIAVPAWILGTFFPIVGGPVIAILLGMLIAIPLKNQGRMAPGIKFTSKKVLQWAVVLLGFGLDLTVVLKTGKQSLPIIVCTIAVSLLIAFVLHKALRIPSKISTLVGVGSSICGGSAIAATAPVIDADDEEVAQPFSSRSWATSSASAPLLERLSASSPAPQSTTPPLSPQLRPPGTACGDWEPPPWTKRSP